MARDKVATRKRIASFRKSHRKFKNKAALNKSLANMMHPLPRPDYPYPPTDINKTLLTTELHAQDQQDFSRTTYATVYVMLPSEIINTDCELVVNPVQLRKQLRTLKSVKVDGVAVHIWWGIVEANNPLEYNWKGYKQLFQIVRKLGFKIQVVMSFHERGGDIPLPKWIKEIGDTNPDIYFTDREGRRNPEALTWGIDEEPVLRGRTAVGVYSDYMRSFRAEFDEFFRDRIIAEVEIGLGACGELRYPSHPARHGWEYPGIGEFQCYDKYLRKSLEKTAEATGHELSWGKPPDNAGSYNSKPQDTKFFCDGGEYDNEYGRFFLKWYSQCLIDHGARVLTAAKAALWLTGPVATAAKVSGMDWWYETTSRAVEGTAGFSNGFPPVASMLREHKAAINFTCGNPPGGFVWQVLHDAWISLVRIGSENAFPCYDRQGYMKILEVAKPKNEPKYGRRVTAFTYHGLNETLFQQDNLREFQLFVRRMHAEGDPDSIADRLKKRKSSTP